MDSQTDSIMQKIIHLSLFMFRQYETMWLMAPVMMIAAIIIEILVCSLKSLQENITVANILNIKKKNFKAFFPVFFGLSVQSSSTWFAVVLSDFGRSSCTDLKKDSFLASW